ncbi:MAG: sigma-70 family RNA polymerase sigma factor [Gammaproteobacteria bacterium]|jgi:RNA polymerase sigma-70 factor (ECF subfamily)|nr:sigma-70 family RNA polymerase sigma factor [Gammaproteobacteria bacterium]
MATGFAQPVEEDLIAAARQGRRSALEILFRRFERSVFTLALRVSGSDAEAQDVLQDTFIDAFTRLVQLRRDAAFGPWLRRITLNHALGRLRQARRFSDEDPADFQGADGEAMRTQQRLDLNGALARLSPLSRTVLWLHDVEGMTHSEIASTLEQSESFSKSRLSRAHARLRELLTCENPKQITPIQQSC